MKADRLNIKLFLTIVLAISFLLPAAQATPYLDYFNRSDSLNIDSLDARDNYVYLVMNINSTFGDPGIDQAILIRYDTVADNYARYDRLAPSGSQYMNLTSYRRVEQYSWDYHVKSLYVGASQMVLTGITNGTECRAYKFDAVNNIWTKFFSYRTATGLTSCYKTAYYDISSTYYPNNNLYHMAIADYPLFPHDLYSFYSSNNSYVDLGLYSDVQDYQNTVYKVIGAISTDKIMSSAYYLEPTNFSIVSVSASDCSNARKGVYLPRDERVYCIVSAGNDIGVVYHPYNQSQDDVKMTTLSTSCLGALAGIELTGIDCKDHENCIITGYHELAEKNYSDILFFDGTECYYMANGTGDYEQDGKTAFDVEYIPASDRYWIGGTKLFGYIIASALPGVNGSIPSSIPGGGMLYYSSLQCVNSPLADYTCNRSIYIDNISSSLYNSFVCSIDDLKPCQGGCMQYILDINTTESWYYQPLKTCYETNTQYTTGINIDCYEFENTIPTLLLGPIVLPIYAAYCAYGAIKVTVPTTYCEDYALWDIIAAHPTDTFYVKGYCQNITCQDTCANNTYSCLNTEARGKCKLQQTGCYAVEFLDYCDFGYTCHEGNCVPTYIINPPGANQTSTGLEFITDLFNCDGKSTAYQLTIWLIMTAIVAIVSIGFSIALGLGPKITAFFGAFSITAVTIFSAIIGCIPIWIIIVLFIICAVVVTIIVRNIFVSDGGAGGM